MSQKEIKKIKHRKMFWGMRGEALLAVQRQHSEDLPTLWQWQNWMELPQHTLSWKERERIEREKAADVNKVQSPISFITIFYQAAYSQKQIEESAKATALALAWNPLWNWSEGFEQGFQTTRWCAALHIWFSVWQIEEPVFFPIFRITCEKNISM